jgi:hypothetical protein
VFFATYLASESRAQRITGRLGNGPVKEHSRMMGVGRGPQALVASPTALGPRLPPTWQYQRRQEKNKRKWRGRSRGPPRKRPHQETFSDDGRGRGQRPPGRLTNGTGSSASSDLAISKKARKKQEKWERKEQRKK